MKRLLLICCLLVPVTSWASDVLDPMADPSAVVIEGNARFTVLTDRLIRMGEMRHFVRTI